MRKSRYTSAVPDGADYLLYNSATGAFAVCDADVFAQFEQCEGEHAAAMVDAGFLTELTAEEELAWQEMLFEAQREDHSDLTLVLSPTYACNLQCPYCYEQGHNSIRGKMAPEVRDAICAFVATRFADHPFERLSVQWYGGDPSLALDVVEELSMRLIGFCEDHGADYEAMILTNCNLVDEAAAKLLARCRVTEALVTIDGLEETHNKRRKSAVGLNSFERNIEAVRFLTECGISVHANMNLDRVNLPEYHPLHDMLYEELGVDLSCGRLCDYGHFFGTRDFTKPDFDLMTHQEFCESVFDMLVRNGFSAEQIAQMLEPVPRFCRGQKHDYFVIDTIGDVYLCDGHMGESEHVLFNIRENPTSAQLESVSHNPHDSMQCRTCHLLPVCQGNCDWERRAGDMPCHPLLTMLPKYLHAWRSCYGKRTKPYWRLH